MYFYTSVCKRKGSLHARFRCILRLTLSGLKGRPWSARPPARHPWPAPMYLCRPRVESETGGRGGGGGVKAKCLFIYLLFLGFKKCVKNMYECLLLVRMYICHMQPQGDFFHRPSVGPILGHKVRAITPRIGTIAKSKSVLLKTPKSRSLLCWYLVEGATYIQYNSMHVCFYKEEHPSHRYKMGQSMLCQRK